MASSLTLAASLGTGLVETLAKRAVDESGSKAREASQRATRRW